MFPTPENPFRRGWPQTDRKAKETPITLATGGQHIKAGPFRIKVISGEYSITGLKDPAGLNIDPESSCDIFTIKAKNGPCSLLLTDIVGVKHY